MKEAVRTRLFWVVAALAIVALVAVGLISVAAQADSVAYASADSEEEAPAEVLATDSDDAAPIKACFDDSCCTNAEEVYQEFGNKDV